jgi:hypothetical protein
MPIKAVANEEESLILQRRGVAVALAPGATHPLGNSVEPGIGTGYTLPEREELDHKHRFVSSHAQISVVFEEQCGNGGEAVLEDRIAEAHTDGVVCGHDNILT